MAGNDPDEAQRNFFGPLEEAVSCVADGGHVELHWPVGDNLMAMLLDGNGDEGVAMVGGVATRLYACWHYQVVTDDRPELGPWRTTTRDYMYNLDSATTDQGVVDYHWHPDFGAKYAHVHVAAPGLPAGWVQVGIPDEWNLHPVEGLVFTTERVSLEYVIRQAIERFGVTPNRPDWDEVLTRLEGRFDAVRGW